MADRIKGITIEINGDSTGLSKALKDVNGEIKSTQSALKDVNRLLKLDPGNTELAAQKQKLLKDAIDETKKKLETLKEAEKQVEQQFAEGKISQEQYDALKREIIDTENKLKSLEQQASKVNQAFEKIGQIGGQLQKAGGKIEDIGNAVMPVSMAVAGIGAAAVKTTADFDSGMSKVQAISGATESELSAMRDKAREMGAQTKFSASEAADAFTYMAMAGWKSADMMDGIAGIMNLAAADGLDLATTSDIVTDAMTAFGLQAKDSGHFADVLAKASSSANTNVAMLGESFKYAAPVAGALGYDVEDVATALGLMANSGIKGSMAGTALRSALTRLAKPTKQTADYMARYGISLTDAEGNMKPLMGLMEDLREKFQDLDEAEQAEAAAGLFGQEAMAGWLSIVNASEKDFGALADAISNSEGTAKQMAETMQNNLSGQVTILKSALEEAAISIGDRLTPKIRELVAKIQEWTNWFNSLSDAQKDTIVQIGLFVAALGPALVIIGKVVIGIGQLMTAVSTIGTTMTAFAATAGPAALVIGALGLMALGFAEARFKAEEYEHGLKTLSTEEQEHVDKITDLKTAYDEIETTRQAAIEGIKTEATHQQTLLDRLKEITDEHGNVKQGYEDEAAAITGELSQALGTEIELRDGQIRNYQEICSALDQVIQKKQAEALIEANREAYSEALKNQTDAYMSYKAVQDDVAQTEREIAAASAEAEQMAINLARSRELEAQGNQQAAQTTGNYSQAMTDAQERVKGLQEQLTQQNEALTNAETVMVNYATVIQNQNDLMAAVVTGDQDKIREAVQNASNSFITAETGTRESLERQLLDFQTKYAAMKAAVEQNAPGITQAQVNEMATMVQKSQAELDKLPEATGNAITSAAAAVTSNTELSEAGKSVGADFDAGLAGGITENAEQINAAASTAAGEAEAGARDATQTHSPSVVAWNIGADFDAGLANGISENAEQINTAVVTVTEGAITKLQAQLQTGLTATQSFQATTGASWSSWAATLLTQLTSTYSNMSSTTTTNMEALRSTIMTKIEAIKQHWEKTWTEIQNQHRKAMTDMKTETSNSMQEMQTTTDTAMTAMGTTVQTKTGEMKTSTETAMKDMLTAIKTNADQIQPTVQGGFEPAVQYIKNLIPQAYTWGTDFMNNYIRAMRDKMDDLEDAMEDAADIVSDYLECSRPDKGPMHTYPIWGKDFMEGYADSLRTNEWRVLDQMTDLTGKMAQTMTGDNGSGKPFSLSLTSQTILDGRVLAETVNEQLGVIL